NRRVIAAVDDMFFASKIRGTAEQLGVQVVFPRGADALIEAARAESPSLIIVDLHSQRSDPFDIAARLKADETLRDVPVLGFFSHVRVELQRRARDAGFDRVLPRSAFANKLPEILRGDL
ncbi:MAG: response regulator, partial [Pyrinomonadaceae bacterium]